MSRGSELGSCWLFSWNLLHTDYYHGPTGCTVVQLTHSFPRLMRSVQVGVSLFTTCWPHKTCRCWKILRLLPQLKSASRSRGEKYFQADQINNKMCQRQQAGVNILSAAAWQTTSPFSITASAAPRHRSLILLQVIILMYSSKQNWCGVFVGG